MTRKELAKIIRDDFERISLYNVKSDIYKMKLNSEALSIILDALEEDTGASEDNVQNNDTTT